MVQRIKKIIKFTSDIPKHITVREDYISHVINDANYVGLPQEYVTRSINRGSFGIKITKK